MNNQNLENSTTDNTDCKTNEKQSIAAASSTFGKVFEFGGK